MNFNQPKIGRGAALREGREGREGRGLRNRAEVSKDYRVNSDIDSTLSDFIITKSVTK